MSLGGGFVADHLPYEKITDRISLSSGYIATILENHKPDVIVNCIGKTGRPNVDWCESNKEITASTNTALPILLAAECAKQNIHLIQIGSGCIYFGPSKSQGEMSGAPDPGWREEDFANPKSFYSKTKYACDLMIGSMDHVTTLRIRMPISNRNTERNLINKLRGYKQVIDIPNSVTFMDDLARCVDWAAQGRKTGIFHVTNPQPLTAARIMREYQKYVPDHQFEIITEDQLDKLTTAKRSNCILSTEKLNAAGFKMSETEEALARCMADYARSF